MLWKRTKRFWKCGLAAISFALLVGIFVGGRLPETRKEREVAGQAEEERAALEEICLDLYKKAEEEGRTDELETIGAIVRSFGAYGYPAVDSKNQVDMEKAEQLLQFCRAVDRKQEAEITVFEVDYREGFVKYDLQAKEGNVQVQRSYYRYENGAMRRKSLECYPAEDWKYTKEGYLMFSGVHFSEERYAQTLSMAEKHTALRIAPLDETCREWNRTCILPVGYAYNNMFLTEWKETDFGELNFYDMYDIFYEKLYGKEVPYTADKNVGVRAVYQIPEGEFEAVLMKYFRIAPETLRSKTVYCPETGSYAYSPRGLEETEYPEYPYPEVFDFTENSDGTITLLVRAVFPYAGDSNVYVHEVVVRPLEKKEVQYVSNKIVSAGKHGGAAWHTPRLMPGGQEEKAIPIPKAQRE